jgi:hypothetical protein
MNWIRQEKRLAILLRDGCACMYCGASVESGARLTLDHVRPASKGGSNSERNLVACCDRCNSVRQDRPAEDFAADVARYLGKTSGAEIMAAIRSNTRRSLVRYRAEAQEMIARRGSAAKALAEMVRS